MTGGRKSGTAGDGKQPAAACQETGGLELMYGHQYTPEEREFLHVFASGHTYLEIMDEYNKRFCPEITVSRVKGYMGNNKISTGTTGQFKKGHIPANKGTHDGGWKPTQFKKGHMPACHKPVGSERIDNKDGYVLVKTKEPGTWELKHRVIWEQNYGPIPKGKCLIFLNGDKTDMRIENLMLIDRGTNARLNQSGLRFEDESSTRAAVGVGELLTAIGKAKSRRRKQHN